MYKDNKKDNSDNRNRKSLILKKNKTPSKWNDGKSN